MNDASGPTANDVSRWSSSGSFDWIADWLTAGAMLIAVAAVYWAAPPPGHILWGADYQHLHQYRMSFAREALLGADPTLPSWHPHELFGSPFWANIQNFPFLPTRLLVLLGFDPAGGYAYVAAIQLAAGLAALFCWLFCRRIGMDRIGAATAGWTFACSGYFASRIVAGHLPLLEVYCALPLLLWAVESLWQQRRGIGRFRARSAVLAVSCALVVLAGHPQLPFYALVCAAIYAVWRFGARYAIRPLLLMACGVGAAAFAWVPMLLLIARSTRVLDLDPASNDLAMPYSRLLGFFLPWRDGAGAPLARARIDPFPNEIAYVFWDTFIYIGFMPWLAVLALAAYCAVRRRLPSGKVTLFVAGMGIAGIVLSSPLIQNLLAHLPGTFLRSPARLIYVTELALAIGMGAGVHVLIRSSRGWMPRAAMVLLVGVHFVDLARISREFIFIGKPIGDVSASIAQIHLQTGDRRVALDAFNVRSPTPAVDNPGFFDSIMLAGPYNVVLSLQNLPPKTNIQVFDGSRLPRRALELLGVAYVVTRGERDDLELLRTIGRVRTCQVPSPASRAEFFGVSRTVWLSPEEIHERLRDPSDDLRGTLLLNERTAGAIPHPEARQSGDAEVRVWYDRPSSDEIRCTLTAAAPGYVRILESHDPGWRAQVNGRDAQILKAMDAFMAIPVDAGTSEVVLQYRTPGATAGAAISVICIILGACGIAIRWNDAGAAATPAGGR